MEKFNNKKLNKVESKEQQYHVEILKWFAAFVNLDSKIEYKHFNYVESRSIHGLARETGKITVVTGSFQNKSGI